MRDFIFLHWGGGEVFVLSSGLTLAPLPVSPQTVQSTTDTHTNPILVHRVHVSGAHAGMGLPTVHPTRSGMALVFSGLGSGFGIRASILVNPIIMANVGQKVRAEVKCLVRCLAACRVKCLAGVLERKGGRIIGTMLGVATRAPKDVKIIHVTVLCPHHVIRVLCVNREASISKYCLDMQTDPNPITPQCHKQRNIPSLGRKSTSME